MMRQVPGYSLWLGHTGDLRDPHSVMSAGILAVVDLALNESPATLPRELVYCRFPLLDGIGNPAWLLSAAVGTVLGLLRSQTPTLVSCSAGLSRTPAIAAAAIARLKSCCLAEALLLVTQSAPADVSPGLLQELESLHARPLEN